MSLKIYKRPHWFHNRYSKWLICSFIFNFQLSTFNSYAQWNDAIVDNHSTGKISVGTYGTADFSSNAITTAFGYNFISGNYIGDDLKQQVSSNLHNTNRFGLILNYGLYAVLHSDTISRNKVFNFFIALRHKKYVNADFTPDDFNIPFYGNTGYAGKTAQLSPFNFNNLSYQQGEIGLVCTNFGGNAQFGAGISFLAGQQYSSIDVPYATLYTNPNGESLTFNSNARVLQSDTSSGYLNQINGYGASLDIYFRAPYKIGGKTGFISVSVADLGFIWWNKQSLSYNKDTGYTYTGLTINNLTDLRNAGFNTLSEDTLKNKYFPFQKGGFYSTIPTTLTINTNTALSQKVHLELGYWYMFNANAIGYVYVQADRYFPHDLMVALQAGYGEYAGINGSLSLVKQFHSSGFGFCINHLQGIVLPDRFGGAGCSINYVYTFCK